MPTSKQQIIVATVASGYVMNTYSSYNQSELKNVLVFLKNLLHLNYVNGSKNQKKSLFISY